MSTLTVRGARCFGGFGPDVKAAALKATTGTARRDQRVIANTLPLERIGGPQDLAYYPDQSGMSPLGV
jgi:hypothetical protein